MRCLRCNTEWPDEKVIFPEKTPRLRSTGLSSTAFTG